MTTSSLALKSLPRLPVSEGATSPNPGIAGVFAWSTTLSKTMVWGGASWNAVNQKPTYDELAAGSSVLIQDFIPANIWTNIVAGTNSTPVHAYVQAALDACAASHSTLIFSPYKFLMSAGVTYNYGTHSIVGNGAELNYSSITSAGVCFSITTPNNFYPLWDLAVYSLNGLNIKGINYGGTRITGLIGVQFGIGLSNSGAHAAVQNCTITGFDTGVSFGDHSYVQKIDSCAIHNCNTAILYSGVTLNDSGERLGFTNCVIFNSLTLAHAIAGNMSFSNCSFDYFTQEAIIAELGGSVYISDCHIESINSPNLRPWLLCKDSNSRICLSNTIIIVNETVSVYIGIADESATGGDVGSADAGIYLVNTHVSFTPTGAFTLPTIFKGAVYIDNLTSFDGGRYSTTNKRVHVHVDRNNLFADGSFENYSTPSEWTISSGTAFTAPSIVTTQFSAGAKSLNMAPAAGTTTKIYKSFLCSPGAKPTFGFKVKGSIPSGSFLNLVVGYLGNNGFDSGISSRTFLYSYTATDVNSSTWAIESARAYSRAPIGTTRFYVSLEATGSANVYIDECMIEILDNKPSTPDLNDTSIDKLKDVDTTTVAPTNGQALVWNSTTSNWNPGNVASTGLSAANAESITGRWAFNNGARLSVFDFQYADINDKSTAADSGITFNYSSSYSTTAPFPYYRDFTIFNGKGLAAMKIFGVSRAALFYSGMQFGNFSCAANQISYTGGAGDLGDGMEVAINYNSGYDASTGSWTFPYYRNFHVFDGKGGGLFKASGVGRRVDFETPNVYLTTSINFKGTGTFNTQFNSSGSITANRVINLPNASGTVALNEVTPVLYQTTNYTATTADSVLLMDTGVGVTLTLPAANTAPGKLFRVSNAGANVFTLTATAGLIQWSATQMIPVATQRCVISDGNNWFWC
jgi:hypothetical protein